MQAVILAAGRGTRMKELTESVPKPMLEVNGRTLLEHKFDVLPDDVDEIIIIVGYLGSVIHDRYGGDYRGKRVLYIEQDVLDGTAGALWRARDMLEDRFLVMMGDDIYAAADVEACIAKRDAWAMLVQKTEHIAGGAVTIDGKHRITSIIENSTGAGYAGTNLFALDTRLFEYDMIPKAEGSGEYGLPQTVVAASKESHVPFFAVPATQWIQITSPGDIKKAEEALANE